MRSGGVSGWSTAAGRPVCADFLYGFKAAPRGRTRRRHGAHASAPAGAPAPAAPTPGGWREKHDTRAASHPASFIRAGRASLLPLPELSETGQNPSRPSLTAGQPHL
jgi:hypothetical protein